MRSLRGLLGVLALTVMVLVTSAMAQPRSIVIEEGTSGRVLDWSCDSLKVTCRSPSEFCDWEGQNGTVSIRRCRCCYYPKECKKINERCEPVEEKPGAPKLTTELDNHGSTSQQSVTNLPDIEWRN